MKAKILVTLSLLAMTSTVAIAAGDAAAGKMLAAKQCASCHGADGKGSGNNPALKGLDADHIAKQIAAFKSGARKNPMMELTAKKLSDKDVSDVAAYFSTLK